MADIFVNSNAVGLNDGSDWTNAYTSFASSTSAVDGDRVIVANTHSENVSTATTYTFGSNISVISSSVSGTNTVTEIAATSSQITQTANNDITFTCGDGCSLYGMYIKTGRSLRLSDFRTERCTLETGAQNSGFSDIETFGSGSSWESYYDRRINLSVNTSIGVIVSQNRTNVKLLGGTIETNSTNSSHSAIETKSTSSFTAHGVDCSNFGGSILLGNQDTDNDGFIILTGFKLNSNTTSLVATNTIKQGSRIVIDATDTSSNQRKYNNEYRGIRESDSSVYVDNVESLQNQSHRFTTNTITKGLVEPLRLELAHGIADFSTTKTLTIEIAQDGTTTNLTNAEVWIEVVYPGTNNQSLYDDNRAANTPAAVSQPTSTQDWVGLSGTNARQSLSVTTTQTGVNGLYTVYLCIAKPSITLYANPEATVS